MRDAHNTIYIYTNDNMVQPVITTRIYALHEITIALKFMSCVNSDLPIPAKKMQTPDQPQGTKWINGFEVGRFSF